MLACMLTGCGLTVPKPEIKEAEFDFSVTYEFNGERITISGVYVCEYSGTAWALDGGYNREWNGYIKDGKTEDTFEIGTTDAGDRVELRLAFIPEYFMGDFVDDGNREVPKPYIAVILEDSEGIRILHEPAEVEEYCGAKIIGYEYDEPIENSFGITN